jgi:hypothetical protein
MSRRTFRVLLALVALSAAALRLWHAVADLPDFLEEAVPFRNALDLWAFTGGRTDWNPHLFHYPSLTVYLHYFVQRLDYLVGWALGAFRTPADWFISYLADPATVVVPARLLHVAADASAVLAAGLVGERLRRGAGVAAAVLVALTPTLIETSRFIFIETIMAALALWSLERMLAWREHGGAWRLGSAVALAGLALGAKYPAVVLVVPLAWVLWERRGARGLALWPALVAVVLAVFLLTTPYALLDSVTFRRDITFVRNLTLTGYFGNSGTPGFAYLVRDLMRDAGPAGIGLLLVSLILGLAGLRRAAPAVTVWLYLLGFALPVAVARVEAARYLVALLPAVAVLAAAAVFDLAERVGGRTRRLLRTMLLLALLLPVAVAGVAAAAVGSRYTRIAARRWCETHLGPRDLILAEVYTAQLPSLDARAMVEGSPIFQAAGPEARRRYLQRSWFHVVPVPLSVVGPCASLVQPGQGPPVDVPIFAHVADVNQIFYDPRLFARADYVLTSSAVRGRYEADPVRYGVEAHLYRLLDSTAVVAARFAPHGDVAGPTIVIYRVGARAQAALGAGGSLPSLWWAERIPAAYRREATKLLGVRWQGEAVRGADGALAPWVWSLTAHFDEKIRPFTNAMAVNLAELGRLDAARSYAEATLLMVPDDAEGRLVREFCDRARAARGDSLGRTAVTHGE